MIEGQFHESASWYFRRLADGSVEIQPGATELVHSEDHGQRVVHVIDKNAWASIVASVSAGGEEDGRFYQAQAFHDRVEQIDGASVKSAEEQV